MELTHRYAFPDRFVSGAVGEPEKRVFFVQTRQGSRMTNVVCERQQIRVLAEHISQVLTELEQIGGIRSDREAGRARPWDSDPLDVPLDEDFRAGTMAITWVPETSSLKVELFAQGVYRKMAHPGALGEDDKVLQVVITLDQARDFIVRTGKLLGSHNPSCPFCGQPIWPNGHLCPRCNGYRKQLIDFA
ncbi:MAG: DUF3090 domain-containing protein [Propionibacteriaceae bacterium]|jgi:uncharacterized repeat protein (TIGR03847 family)|uniref:DUF3090 domain-containing protein n=2 Tax=root TaxID=1 RepID=A0AAN0KA70_9ACTN|nr:DUF3090 domain-containing protein [Brooklawnia sp. SH051]MCB0883528.1 DUF3090 domain-containing protein [Propionibacteriaceae bacterium]NLI83812.1 DUF3090 family protein [Propionibacterium sp.]BEH01055.1 DUF3090 domain-containing protein [Brooklawnia sp. SH051]